jgi:lambda repressor-like predicted transcriptional regulator
MTTSVHVDSGELKNELLRRGWSAAELSRQAGLNELTVARALRGESVKLATYQRIRESLERGRPRMVLVA